MCWLFGGPTLVVVGVWTFDFPMFVDGLFGVEWWEIELGDLDCSTLSVCLGPSNLMLDGAFRHISADDID